MINIDCDFTAPAVQERHPRVAFFARISVFGEGLRVSLAQRRRESLYFLLQDSQPAFKIYVNVSTFNGCAVGSGGFINITRSTGKLASRHG